MRRGEIWQVSLDPALGNEQQGTRPVLIVSPDIFNNVTQTPICVPITNGGNYARVRGFTVDLEGHNLQTTGTIRCDQVRVLAIPARNGTLIESVPDAIMNDVMARLAAILK